MTTKHMLQGVVLPPPKKKYKRILLAWGQLYPSSLFPWKQLPLLPFQTLRFWEAFGMCLVVLKLCGCFTQTGFEFAWDWIFIFVLFFGVQYLNVIRNFRPWRNCLTFPAILSYEFQALQTPVHHIR